MSTQIRSGGGSRNQPKKGNLAIDTAMSNKKIEHVKSEKEKPHAKPTAEQMRIAQIMDIKSGPEDPKMREKVANLIETTQRSEEDVCYALYECDNDLDRAVIYLFETLPEGAFEKSSKKKKNRLTSVNNNEGGEVEWGENNNTRSGQNTNTDAKERSRSRGGMRGGRGGSDSRGWRGREARENERNSTDTKNDNWRGGRGGRGGFSSRGNYGSRGGRGGRMGSRGVASRDQGRNYPRRDENLEPVEAWDNSQANSTDAVKADDTWGDWDNEEYTGSLADSKVFTPSTAPSQSLIPSAAELSAAQGIEQQILNSACHTDDLVQQYSTTVVSSTTTAAAAAAISNNNSVQFPEISTSAQHLRQALEIPPMNSSALSAEQSQYFNSLSSQNSNQAANVNSYQATTVQYPASFNTNNNYNDQIVSSQPPVRKARARVPPPSKIPSSAVEMPGDTLNTIGYLDVQFGGLDFGTEDSFDTLSEKFNTSSIDATQSVVNPEISADYQTKSTAKQTAITTGLPTSQLNENITSGFSQRTANSVSQSASINTVNVNNNSVGTVTTGYQGVPYNNTIKTSSYQSSGTPQSYNSSNYANTQASASNSYPPTTNSYNSYNQNSVNSYQGQNNSNNGTTVNNSNTSSSNNPNQNMPVGNSNVNSSSSSTNAAYLSSQYPVTQTSSAFPSQPSGYAQSVYGNSGLSNNTGYSGSTNTSSTQYSNFNSTKLKDNATPISTPFESVTSSTVPSSAVSAVSNSAVSTTSMSSPSLGLTNTKVTNSTTKSSGVVPNIPMVGQYIQAGVPFYQQPVYSYEDIQMMQQRMPHVPGYYDMNYQTPTSLGAAGVRDGNLGSVAYSTMSDGRFTRTDNNSSPVSNVPSTMSQQSGSGGPMLNLPYAYFYSGNMMPGGFQYGTPVYPQQMATANASSGGQFPKPSYNSGYGSTGYDGLSQTAQDYNKNAYPGSGVGQQSKGQSANNPPPSASGSDITSSMYGKSHVALNKVNSYEKQSFHSGTPPPFNLAGSQTAGATSAQAYGMYIPAIPAPHHNINMHQPIHQDTSNTGQRPQSSSQGKTGNKQGYSPSYWTAQN